MSWWDGWWRGRTGVSYGFLYLLEIKYYFLFCSLPVGGRPIIVGAAGAFWFLQMIAYRVLVMVGFDAF